MAALLLGLGQLADSLKPGHATGRNIEPPRRRHGGGRGAALRHVAVLAVIWVVCGEAGPRRDAKGRELRGNRGERPSGHGRQADGRLVDRVGGWDQARPRRVVGVVVDRRGGGGSSLAAVRVEAVRRGR